ncbi:MAG TPA: hypothetical protein VM261_19210 [Kofleriaceae bacterium]|nr:hypothetical protein [Kofleriaceae bacterium]
MARQTKRDHGAEVAAHAVVVRHVVDRAAAAGAPRCEIALGSLALLESWLQGATVTSAQLQQAAQAAHDASRPYFRDHTTPFALSTHWSANAIGNLCWFARKERGWKETVVLDAARYTLTSLLPRTRDDSQAVALDQELKALFARALAAAGSSGRPLAKAPARPRLRKLPDVEKTLGPVVAAALKRGKARIDPTLRGDEPAVRARLAEHGFVAHASVLAFDERWGGLIVARGHEGEDWTFGAFTCVDGGGDGGPVGKRKKLVPVAMTPNDVVYFLDARGAAWAQDTIEEQSASPFADDADTMVARCLLFDAIWLERLKDRFVELDGAHGTRTARLLKLPRVRSATDSHGGFWSDGKTYVSEFREGRKTTTMVAGAAWRRARSVRGA